MIAALIASDLIAVLSGVAAMIGATLGILAYRNQRRERAEMNEEKSGLAQREDVEALLRWKDSELTRMNEERSEFLRERGQMLAERQLLYSENSKLQRDVYDLGNRVSELESTVGPLQERLAQVTRIRDEYLVQLHETQAALALCQAGN